MSGQQTHLNHKQQVDLGSFYTPKEIVDLTYSLLQKNITSTAAQATILDSSCGYGSFLNRKISKRTIGADMDMSAINEARKKKKGVEFFEVNSLQNISRHNYQIEDGEKLIIVGNPPYNDTTSIIRQRTKDKTVQDKVDPDVKTRDMGMSFLLSFNKLRADYICVLHPLSYLIKKTNFSTLKDLTKNYKLIDGIVISSHEFSDTSRGMAFPILISLYKREGGGMSYEYIKDYQFTTKEGASFRLNDFDTIANYISKYPNKKSISNNDKPIAKFYTMRDINALKRNRTFIDKDTPNAIYVVKDKFPHYCYVDVFKKYADKLPYYFGNFDVMINQSEFEKAKDYFIADSINNNPVLKKKFKFRDIPDIASKIDQYFNSLLGEHSNFTN